MNDFWKDNDRFTDRHGKRLPEEKQKIWIFREMLWDAIDNKKPISIVELSKALGIK